MRRLLEVGPEVIGERGHGAAFWRLQRRISRHDLDEMRRDTMIDYFATRLPGAQIDHASKRFSDDFYDSDVKSRVPTANRRGKAAGRVADLRRYIPPPDRSLRGTSSWINYFLDRDSRPRA